MKNLIKLLTVISTILLINAQASAGKWGTGGGDSEAAPVQIEELQSYIINVQKDLPIMSNGLKFLFNYSEKSTESNRDKSYELSRSVNKKLFNKLQLKSILAKYKPRIEMEKPCYNDKRQPKEASIHNTPNDTYCISPYWMLNSPDSKKYNRLSYQGLIVGLIFHELSHILKTNEEEAILVNKNASTTIQLFNLTFDWREKFKKFIEYSDVYMQVMAEQLKNNDLKLCNTISDFKNHVISDGRINAIAGFDYYPQSQYLVFSTQISSLSYCNEIDEIIKSKENLDMLRYKSIRSLAILMDPDDEEYLNELSKPEYFILLVFQKDKLMLKHSLKHSFNHLNKLIRFLNSSYEFDLEEVKNSYIESVDFEDEYIDQNEFSEKIKKHFDRRKKINIGPLSKFSLIKDIQLLDSEVEGSLYFSNGKQVSFSGTSYNEYCSIGKSYRVVKYYTNKSIKISTKNNPYKVSYVDPNFILFLNSTTGEDDLAVKCYNTNTYDDIITKSLIKKHLRGVLEIIE